MQENLNPIPTNDDDEFIDLLSFPRRVLGWIIMLTAVQVLNKLAHRMIHISAWLMDREDAMDTCHCKEE